MALRHQDSFPWLKRARQMHENFHCIEDMSLLWPRERNWQSFEFNFFSRVVGSVCGCLGWHVFPLVGLLCPWRPCFGLKPAKQWRNQRDNLNGATSPRQL